MHIITTVVGVLFNCCEPESISKAIDKIRRDPTIQQHLQHPSGESFSKSLTDIDPPKILLGAYANRLTPVDSDWTLQSASEAQSMREDLSPVKYWKEFVEHWRSSNLEEKCKSIGGVQLIGGCCGIDPSYIAVLKERLAQ